MDMYRSRATVSLCSCDRSQPMLELQGSTELVVESSESSLLPVDLQRMQTPQIDESSANSLWSKESECFLDCTVAVFKGDDTGKIGICKQIAGGKRVKSFTIMWSDLSESVLSRKEFYAKKVVEISDI